MTGTMVSLSMRALPLFAVALFVFWPSLQQMESVWRHSETYMHCYFIVPMTLYMVWIRRDSLKGLTPQPALLPALLLLPVCLLWLSAYAIDVGFVSHISQVVVFQLLLWHLLGNQIAAKIRFPLLFLIFLAPFGESLTPALQEITADIGVALLRLADIPVYREGLYLHTPVTVFEVAVACSGLNFLISSAVISLLFAYLYFHRLVKQVVFVGFVLVLAILANGLRAFLLMLIGEKTNMAWGFGDDHYYYGWLVFAVTMLISFRIGEHFADPADGFEGSGSAEAPAVKASTATFTASAVALLCIAVFYPLRTALPQTVKPLSTAEVLSVQGFTAQTQNPLGTSFTDGIRRSSLRDNSGVEIFAADYAVRQNEGDLITWHNWLFDQKHWTVTDRITTGPLTQSTQTLQLTNIGGRRYTLLYWYQIGEVRTTSKILMKLLQLKAILLHEPVATGVRMLAISGQDFDNGQRLLQTSYDHVPALAEPPQPSEK